VIEALLPDLLMIVLTLLALGLSRAGKSSRTERALILACAAASQVRVGVVLGRAPLSGLFVPEDRPAQVLGEERGDAGRGVRGGEVGHAVLLA
jgi:hypothetical protein